MNEDMEWKDISTHNKGATDRTPHTFQAKVGSARITVTRHVHFAPEDWVLTCEPWYDLYVVGKGTIDEAKAAAVALIREKLRELDGILGAPAVVVPGSLEDLRRQLGAETRDGVWYLPYFTREASDAVVVKEMIPVDIWLERRKAAAALLGRTRQIIEMVHTNNEVAAGKKRKAWSGKFVADEVADLNKSFKEVM